MIKTVFYCEKCEKETLAFDPEMNENTGTLIFDFRRSYISFFCPHCNHDNILDLGKVQEALNRKKSLPKIGGSKF